MYVINKKFQKENRKTGKIPQRLYLLNFVHSNFRILYIYVKGNGKMEI